MPARWPGRFRPPPAEPDAWEITPEPIPPLERLAQRWAAARGLGGLFPLLERLLQAVGPARALNTIEPPELDAWLLHEERRGSPRVQALALLVDFLGWCYDEGWLWLQLHRAYETDLAAARRRAAGTRAPELRTARPGGARSRQARLSTGERERLAAEIDRLRAEEQRAVEAMEEARQAGDLRENAPYEAARQRVAFLRRQRATLEARAAAT